MSRKKRRRKAERRRQRPSRQPEAGPVADLERKWATWDVTMRATYQVMFMRADDEGYVMVDDDELTLAVEALIANDAVAPNVEALYEARLAHQAAQAN